MLNLPVWWVGIPFTSYCSCRCAALSPALEPDSLQRSSGQPAVSQKRDQNDLPPFCHKYYSEVEGGGGAPRLQIGYRAQQWLMPAHKSGNITVLHSAQFSFNASTRRATPVHFYAADLYSIPHTDRSNAWLCASGSLERSRSIPATNTVICKRSEEGGGGERFCW